MDQLIKTFGNRQVVTATNACALAADAPNLIVPSAASSPVEHSFPILGYSRKEALGRPIADPIVPEASGQAQYHGLGLHLAAGKSTEPGQPIVRTAMPEGSEEFLAELSVLSAGSVDDGPPLFVAYLNALSELRRTEATIIEQKLLAAYCQDVGSMLTEDTSMSCMLAQFAEGTVRHLDAAFCSIWLADEARKSLELHASAGIDPRTAGLHPRTPVGKCEIGRIALERSPLLTNALAGDERVQDQEWARREGLVAFAGYPLIVHDGLVGVMALYSRHEFSDATLLMLSSVANQVALGIERMRVEDRARALHADMEAAYDATIDGWARALDLRDQETEGHSRRVTEMTMKLALATGMTESKLVQVRRGAQLHDIGKMGIPDAILLKPGPLTEDEWMVMRRHPTYAHDWLSPIEFIREALEIPYCHHEKWDGSGYPRGLSGEQIPVAARIFAAVAICDALLSDRPYRKGWPVEKVREHIRSLSGSHLDPRVVEAFLPMIGEPDRPVPADSSRHAPVRGADACETDPKFLGAAFHAMLEQSDDFVVLFDCKWRIQAASRSFITTFAPDRDPLGLDFMNLLDLGSQNKLRSLLARTGEGSCTLELNHVTASKTFHLVNYTICELSDPSECRQFTAIGRGQAASLELVEMLILQNQELENSHRFMAEQALSDPLTGLGNRRWLFDQLEVLWAQGRRQYRLPWIMMADLDHFKAVNDTYGHQAGDEVLVAASRAMRGSVRTEDIAARLGGEEFVLAGLCSLECELPALASRVLRAIRDIRIECPVGSLRVTSSLGISLAEPDPSNPPWAILQLADRALYRAKAGGRDRFEVESGLLRR